MNKPQVLMFTWGANSISFFESSTLSVLLIVRQRAARKVKWFLEYVLILT